MSSDLKRSRLPEEGLADCEDQYVAKRPRLSVLKKNNMVRVLTTREITGKPIACSSDVSRIDQQIDGCYGLLPESRPVLQIRQQYSDYLKLLQHLNGSLKQLHCLLCSLLNNLKLNGQMMVMALYNDIYMKLDRLVYEVLNANHSNAKVVVKLDHELDILTERFVHPWTDQYMEAVITKQIAEGLKQATAGFLEQHSQIIGSLKKSFCAT